MEFNIIPGDETIGVLEEGMRKGGEESKAQPVGGSGAGQLDHLCCVDFRLHLDLRP